MVLSLSQNYVLLDQLLFKLITILDKEKDRKSLISNS